MKRLDLTGKVFGLLTVKEHWQSRPRTKNSSYKDVFWLCHCQCGKEKWVSATDLRAGDSTSCGCNRYARTAEHFVTHGFSRKGRVHPMYKLWSSMIRRCHNKNNTKSWKLYGGRGIKVCDAWRQDFLIFLADVGHRPSPRHTLDRWPNKNGNYEPGNVRWATYREQALNRRRVSADWDRDDIIIDWAELRSYSRVYADAEEYELNY